MPTHNTIMAVAAGVGLLLGVALGRELLRRPQEAVEGWTLAFGVPGTVLTTTGLHMTLTWPLAGPRSTTSSSASRRWRSACCCWPPRSTCGAADARC